MTLETFLKELRAAVEGKEHHGTVAKRFSRPGKADRFCPITLVYYHRSGEVLSPLQAHKAAAMLNLSCSIASFIIEASDSLTANPAMRDALVKAWTI